jgi:GT2 family glycosyltransferase/Flp pilus assembly protein TadD
MSSQHLFGPVTTSFAEQNLISLKGGGNCVSFGSSGTDIPLGSISSWEALINSLPAEWQPDFLALWLPYTQIPEWLWSAPVPIIGLAADWNLLWHDYRRILPHCDLILTDAPGVEVMHRAGLSHVRPANLFGLERAFLEEPSADENRDIDILFVGNLHPPVQGDRLPWLARLAKLSERWNVHIATGVFGEEYRRLLRRSKIAFNRSIRGECNKRAFEASACGALLFQESENREIRNWLEEGAEFVAYTTVNLESLLERYLTSDQRQAIAAAARKRVQDYGFSAIWSRTIGLITEEWSLLQERARERQEGRRVLPPTPELCSLLAQLAEMESQARIGNKDAAIRAGRNLLASLQRTSGSGLLGCLPSSNGFDYLRTEWERAAWGNVGDPLADAKNKELLLRWRVHLVLAELTGVLTDYFEAVLARPDLALSQAALGCALARAGRMPEARLHLQQALQSQPFDLAASRALAQVLQDLGDTEARQQLEQEHRLLVKAAPGIVPPDDWFTPPPAADALASIIILCCNEVEATRHCLDSVRRHTRRPYELILIDNGSTDSTPAFLDEVRGWSEPARIVIIHNAENRGYPVGVNQGLTAAKGAFLILLNNDTIVTSEWLDGLIRLSLVCGGAGLVGPVSNGAPPPQLVPFEFREVFQLDAFAEERKRQFAGQGVEFPRLTGFCLLIRRDALCKIGGNMDERYGIGFFEDDDLCVRARNAGLRLRIAPDVFIHHEGGRTFRSLRLDAPALMEQGFQRFREKWGENHAAPYRRPSANGTVQTPVVEPNFTIMSAPHLEFQRKGKSLTMIVKNEEKNLPPCLHAVRSLMDEMVLIDTGSTDRTKEIARELGAKVFDFPWVDSFAAARNESLRRASGEWLFWLDADDRMNEENVAKLQQLFMKLPSEHAAFVLNCRCVEKERGDTATVVTHVRLFRNHPGIFWNYRVHEQILPSLRRTGAKIHFSDVEIQHIGYIDPVLHARKLERNLRLLNMDFSENPDEPFILFNLGSVYDELKRPADALPLLSRSLELSHPDDSIVRKLYAMIANCQRRLGRPNEAVKACQTGRQRYPDDPELLLIEGLARDQAGDINGSESAYRRLVDGRENGNHFTSVAEGLRRHLGRHNLAILLLKQKRFAEAEAQWRMALMSEPDFLPAKIGLGELYLDQQNFTALEQVVEQFADHPEAVVLRARAKMARKEFASARWELTEGLERYPNDLRLRVILSHVLLQEDKDPIAAEQALRNVLLLDPNHVEAKRNLGILLSARHGKI